jgi:hypothetical protein
MKTVLFHFYFLLALSAFAQPINYQGRLSDKSGTNVNGTKNFSLRIFDAKTGGKQIYEENVGAVTVNEGAYSFNFGETGKSVVTPTETIAFADGEKQIFNYTVKNTPVLGEIKISGGGYSWTESGSSDATKFTATANKNSGAVSAIFLTGAPEAGENVSISYDHNSDGVIGALSRGGQAWLEVAVGGETLSPRERLVAVPFALRAGVANGLIEGHKIALLSSNNGRSRLGYLKWRWPTKKDEYSRFSNGTSGPGGDVTRLVFIPKNISHLELNLSFRGNNGNSGASGKEIPANEKIPFDFKMILGQRNFKSAGIDHRYIMNSPPTGWQRLDLFGKKTEEAFLQGPILDLMGISLIGTIK